MSSNRKDDEQKLHICCGHPKAYGGTRRTGFSIDVIHGNEIPGFIVCGDPYQPKEDVNQYARLCREVQTGALCLLWSSIEELDTKVEKQ